jgi:hypothetical protein
MNRTIASMTLSPSLPLSISRTGNLIVAVPVAVVDAVMPTLKDTEWRVLLCILRQTRVLGRERHSAWLTHAELCRRTGRASEAVSAAIAVLAERLLIEVRDENGRILATARERQMTPGRRFYRVAEPMVPLSAGKAKTIETEKENVYGFRKIDQREALSAPEAYPSDSLTLEQRDRIEAARRKIRERLECL